MSDTLALVKPQYFLKTAPVLSSATNSKFGNLYLRHHSGGINAIMIMPSPPKFVKANSTTDSSRVLFASASHPERQWCLVLGRNTNAREDKLGAWQEVLIVENEGDEGFVWEASGDIPGGEELVWKGGRKYANGEAEDREVREDAGESGRWRGWIKVGWFASGRGVEVSCGHKSTHKQSSSTTREAWSSLQQQQSISFALKTDNARASLFFFEAAVDSRAHIHPSSTHHRFSAPRTLHSTTAPTLTSSASPLIGRRSPRPATPIPKAPPNADSDAAPPPTPMPTPATYIRSSDVESLATRRP
ncbi:hypothetical protein GALMADRAFT_160971 [Galerina marginata CBS 339.88]|uniref:DUF7907 domain-containing protein n=1 Tax=Galerina marginata (strain CBS 339.88) TaxID=685588 RepID=A0A067SCF2_GALM3|nr:hypothetical protein GALMADRAFT_160971 [Galerina marginata CBS 339.88]